MHAEHAAGPSSPGQRTIEGQTLCLKLHARVVWPPNQAKTAKEVRQVVDELVARAQQVFDAALVRIDLVSTERLPLPEFRFVDVGACSRQAVTNEMRKLFQNRVGVSEGEVVAYFIRMTDPPMDGCAAYPAGCPGFVITRGADKWTLGHELGHVLGLPHIRSLLLLMTDSGTSRINQPPPDLDADEIARIRKSRWLFPC